MVRALVVLTLFGPTLGDVCPLGYKCAPYKSLADCYDSLGRYGPLSILKYTCGPCLWGSCVSEPASSSAVSSSATDTCSLYSIDGDTCGQSDLDCTYVKYAKLAEKSLKDGTCASQGYTVKGSTTTKSYPVIGDIVITEYTKPSKAVSSSAADTCSLYSIDGDTCGQSDLDCTYVKYAKLAEKSLKDGTCASQGYTVKGSTTTKSYPVIGDIVITEYTKPSRAVSSSATDTCSLYSIDGDTCGQSDLDCTYVKYAKLAEKSLEDGTCASQGYTVKGSTTTKSYPVIGDIVITQYTKPSHELIV